MELNGRWRGWYAYGSGGAHHPMELALTIKGAELRGAGMDDIGTFTVLGTWADDGARVTWLKSYPTHSVDYAGAYDGRFIRGGWRLGSGAGTFCLWPDGSGELAAESGRRELTKEAS